MSVQDGGWRAGLKDGSARISLGARSMARGLLDLLLPPMAHDSREASARVLLSAGARAVDLAVIARVRTAREPPK